MTNPIDISSEEYRIYTYPNGDMCRIDDPAELYVLADESGDSHRVVDRAGMTHRPNRGWIMISWMPRAGQKAFVA
jgi:hypothetical protein